MKLDYKRNIAISAIWYERFLECSRTIRTDEFVDSVWRFYYCLLNLGEEKLAILDIVTNYMDTEWYPIVNKKYLKDLENHIGVAGIEPRLYRMAEQSNIIDLFKFIIQTIQDSGVGWPTSEEMQSFQIKQE